MKNNKLIIEGRGKTTDKPAQQKTKAGSQDPVFARYGDPFIVSPSGKVKLNDRAVAVKCATLNRVRYDTVTKHFERYNLARGLWVPLHEVEVLKILDDLLQVLAEQFDQQEFLPNVNAAKLAAVAKMLKPHDLKFQSQAMGGLVHAANGVISLLGQKPELLTHDPKYLFRHSSEIQFNPKAACPKFLKFLESVLGKADIALAKKYFGSMFLGANTCHGIMVIRGTPGGGKSTLVTIVEKVLGEHLVAYLRTLHLGGRFETSAFLGKRLLVGKDVPGDALSVSGARMLKSLSGNDLMQAEIKFAPDKQALRGDFHVIIVSNNQLRIALDGDEDAWRRRLLVVDFINPKPQKPIPNLAEKLYLQEASGILNWLIEGAAMFAAEMKEHGHLQLTEAQSARIDTLLENSDNIPAFVNRCLAPNKGSDVTSEELLLGYYRVCKSENWTPVSSHEFQSRVPELLAQLFQTTRRNDITRNGRAVRGFKNVTLK